VTSADKSHPPSPYPASVNAGNVDVSPPSIARKGPPHRPAPVFIWTDQTFRCRQGINFFGSKTLRVAQFYSMKIRHQGPKLRTSQQHRRSRSHGMERAPRWSRLGSSSPRLRVQIRGLQKRAGFGTHTAQPANEQGGDLPGADLDSSARAPPLYHTAIMPRRILIKARQFYC